MNYKAMQAATRNIKSTVIILYLLINWGSAFAQFPTDMSFDYLPVKVKEGDLSNKKSSYVLQDSRGFLWVATESGLNMYDGYNYHIFLHDAKDSTSIIADYIYFVIEDINNNILVGTNAGIDRYDPKDGQFHRVPLSDGNSFTGSNRSARFGIKTKDNTILTVVVNQLYLYNNETHALENTGVLPQSNAPQLTEFVTLTELPEGTVWVGFNNYLGSYKIKTKEKKTFDMTQNPAFMDPNVAVVFKDADGNLGIFGTNHRYTYDLKTGSLTEKPVLNFDFGPTDLEKINPMYQDETTNNYWFGTNFSHLVIFNPSTSSFIYRQILDENGNLQGRICRIIKDKQGIYWMASNQNGLYYVYPNNQNSFSQLTPQEGNENSLSHNSIATIMKSSDGLLYIGTDGGGLNIYNPITKNFKILKNNPNDNTSVSTNAVLGFLEDSKGNIWVGGYAGGLMKYNPETSKFKRYMPDPNNPYSITHHDVRNIVEGNDGLLYIVTVGGKGLNIFNPETETFRYFEPASTTEADKLCNPALCVAYKDSKGLIWVGGYGGLSKYDPATETFRSYYHAEGDTTTLSHNWVYAISEDANSNLWIGTAYGLNKFNPENETFTSYTTSNGLPDNIINCIVPDQFNTLWLSTNKGISRFYPEILVFKNYNNNDGLKVEQFIHGSSFKDKDGIIYFGGLGGLVSLDPKNFFENKYLPEIYFTGFQLFYKDIPVASKGSPLKNHIAYTKKIILTHKQNIITIKYVALNYISPQKNQYKVMMEGFDDGWVDVGSRREATYTNLNPGKYTFRVIASNNDGVWNQEGSSITIKIKPPFWRTWWFYLLILIAILAVIRAFIKWRESQLKHDKMILENELDNGRNELTKKIREADEHKAEIYRRDIDEREQKWYNQGMIKFTDIISKNREDIDKLARVFLYEIIKYIDADQGGICLLNDNVQDDMYLELVASYAYDKERLEQKRFQLGEGQVGTCFKEMEIIKIKNLPESYTVIGSGLGRKSPKNLLLFPLKQNEIAIGVLEIASFHRLKNYKLKFIEDICETLASTMISAKASQKMKTLIETLNLQGEELATQEEELRQNLEEMKATQDEYQRREDEMIKMSEELATKEQELIHMIGKKDLEIKKLKDEIKKAGKK